MNNILKTGTIIFMAMAMLVGFAACAKPPIQMGEPKESVCVAAEITFTMAVSNDEEKVAPDAFIKAFETMYPDAKVIKDYSSGDIVSRIASGDIGDVFCFPETNTYMYAVTHEALMPIDAYLERFNVDVSDVYSGIFDLGVVNGRLYMSALSHGHIVLFTNVDALAKEGLKLPEDGWSWDTFLNDYAPKLTKLKDDGTYSQVAMNIPINYDPTYIGFLEGWGGEWYDTVNKKISLISDPKVLQGITAMIEAAEAGYLYPTGKGDLSKYKGLRNKDYVFRHFCHAELFQFGTEADLLGINWDITSYPHFPVPKVGTGASGYGVYNRTKRPDTAAALALFTFTQEGQRALNGQSHGAVPLMKSLVEEDFWRGKGEWVDKNYDAFVTFPDADTVGRVNCRIPTPVANKITGGAWDTMLRSHFNGTADFKDSLKKIETSANETWAKLVEKVIGI